MGWMLLLSLPPPAASSPVKRNIKLNDSQSPLSGLAAGPLSFLHGSTVANSRNVINTKVGQKPTELTGFSGNKNPTCHGCSLNFSKYSIKVHVIVCAWTVWLVLVCFSKSCTQYFYTVVELLGCVIRLLSLSQFTYTRRNLIYWRTLVSLHYRKGRPTTFSFCSINVVSSVFSSVYTSGSCSNALHTDIVVLFSSLFCHIIIITVHQPSVTYLCLVHLRVKVLVQLWNMCRTSLSN